MKKGFTVLLLLAILCAGCTLPRMNVSDGASEDVSSDSALSEPADNGTAPFTEAYDSADQMDPNDALAAEPVAVSGRDTAIEAEAEDKIAEMSMDEKIAQLFVVTPETLTGYSQVTAAGEATQNAIDRMPVGGIIYMKANLQSQDQVRTMITKTQTFSEARIGLRIFTFVDEEGGEVRRVSGNLPGIPEIGDMADIGARGNAEEARQIGKQMGSYLAELGFTCDFAPVADVLTNPSNQVVKRRSFGSDPERVSDMSIALAEGLSDSGVHAVFKHFPGHGATAADTHEGYAYTDKTLEELRACELVPFRKAIEAGADFIMTAHISLPNVTEADVPASLSAEITEDLLRNEMGYDGIVITDALNMGAIVEQYGAGEACVRAIEAGADLLLEPTDLEGAYAALKSAVQSGRISEERIDESLRRILQVKLEDR